MLGLAVGEELLDWSMAIDLARGSDSVHDDLHLLVDNRTVTTLVGESCKDRSSLVLSTFCEKPSRRLWKSGHQYEDDGSEEDLECNWEAPDKLVWSVGASIVDPVGDKGSDGDVSTLDTDELASVMGFGSPDGKVRKNKACDRVSGRVLTQPDTWESSTY